MRTHVSERIPNVFYLPWQKEMGELSTGVYNLLKSTSRQHVVLLTVRQRRNF